MLQLQIHPSSLSTSSTSKKLGIEIKNKRLVKWMETLFVMHMGFVQSSPSTNISPRMSVSYGTHSPTYLPPKYIHLIVQDHGTNTLYIYMPQTKPVLHPRFGSNWIA
jgi:hypothetical protein